MHIEKKKTYTAFFPFLLLSVRANRNDTYLCMSLSLSLSALLFLDAYFALLFMKSQRKANIEKRAQPVKSRVNKTRDNEGELKHIHKATHRFLFVFFFFSSLLLTIYGRSIIFLSQALL